VQQFDLRELAHIGFRVIQANTGGDRTHGGMAILFNPYGEVLFTLAKYRPSWNFPGGFCDRGEHPAAGIRRELHEEVAYPLDGPPLSIVHSERRRVHTEYVAVGHVDRDTADRLHSVSWEIRRTKWCGPHNMPAINSQVRSLFSESNGVIAQLGNRWIPGPKAQAVLDGEMLPFVSSEGLISWQTT
jgi:8-oxo-dGTP pyrophosphatase MutT (NUDIX family)